MEVICLRDAAAMRWGIVSDIHANLEALRAVLEALGEVDAYLCLGDIVGYGADPNACVEMVRGLRAVRVVAGNHDLAAVGEQGVEEFNPYAAAAVLWTRRALAPDHMAYLKALPLVERVGEVTVVHGSLPYPMGYVLSARDAMRTMAHGETPLTLIGHTHVAEYYRLRAGEGACARVMMTQGGQVTLHAEARYLVNCGGVGQPRDGNPLAACGIYDSEGHEIDIKRVPYDIAAAQRKILEAGLPEVLARRLALGL